MTKIPTENIKKGLRRKRRTAQQSPILLSTGSTVLDLACSGRVEGGLLSGEYYFFCGDTDSGKTWMGMSLFAEASINPAFDNYRLIYDGVEGGALMDIEKYFGKKAAERIGPPATKEGGIPVCSDTIESFYFHVADALDAGKPFIYVLDSQDCLTSKSEIKKFE